MDKRRYLTASKSVFRSPYTNRIFSITKLLSPIKNAKAVVHGKIAQWLERPPLVCRAAGSNPVTPLAFFPDLPAVSSTAAAARANRPSRVARSAHPRTRPAMAPRRCGSLVYPLTVVLT